MATIKDLTEKQDNSNQYKILLWCGIIFVVIVFIAVLSDNKKNTAVNNDSTSAKQNVSTQVVVSSDIYPHGELAEMFEIGSRYTELQRETKLNELKGKTVEWNLPLYEIRKDGSKYQISTINDNFVNCIIYITAKTEEDVRILHALKTGDVINFRGTFTGKTFLRSLILDNAVLLNQEVSSAMPTDNYINLGNIEVRGTVEAYFDSVVRMWFLRLVGSNNESYLLGALYEFTSVKCLEDGNRVKIRGNLQKWSDGGLSFESETLVCTQIKQ